MPNDKNSKRCFALGRNISRLRKKKSLSQEKLAEAVDIHASYIGQIERGMKYPSLKVLFKIADSLEVKITELFKGIDADKSNKKS